MRVERRVPEKGMERIQTLMEGLAFRWGGLLHWDRNEWTWGRSREANLGGECG